MLGHAEVVTAARNLMERIDPATAGLWPRATALLARQALEGALDDFWRRHSPGMELCSMRAQLLCLPHFLPTFAKASTSAKATVDRTVGKQASSHKPQADNLAQRVSYAWAGLSGACHQHPYELPPTSVELLGWLGKVEELVARVALKPA